MTNFDLDAAAEFITTHARTLDRRRFERLLGHPDSDGVIAALTAYQNPDNGFGWGLEPDLRSRTSQPAAALHAFETIAEVGPTTTPFAVALCDWLETIALPDGGLPFALPIDDPVGCAPFWVQADPTASSLQITAMVTFLDAVADSPETSAALDQLRPYVPADGSIHVDGGTDDETLHPLDLAPDPNGPARTLLTAEAIAADLDRIAREQKPDGGWQFDWTASSPGAVSEWRGYVTVRAVGMLLDNA